MTHENLMKPLEDWRNEKFEYGLKLSNNVTARRRSTMRSAASEPVQRDKYIG